MLSSNFYNDQSPDIVVLAITSNLSPNPFKVFVDRKNLDTGYIPVKSAIRVDKPFSFLKKKVLKVLGTISAQKHDEVMSSLQLLLQTNPPSNVTVTSSLIPELPQYQGLSPVPAFAISWSRQVLHTHVL